jgi:hypothetical protein
MSDGSSEDPDQGDASDVVEEVAGAQPPSTPATRPGNKRDYTFLNLAGLAAEAYFAHQRAKTTREVEATGTPRPAAASTALTLIAVFIPHYRTGNSPAVSQGIGHLYSKMSFMRRAEL